MGAEGSKTVTVQETAAEVSSSNSSKLTPAQLDELVRVASIVHPTPSTLTYDPDFHEAVYEEVAGVPGAFIIRNFLSPQECAALVAETEKIGYSLAPISTSEGAVVMTDVRDNKRCMMEATPEHLRIWASRAYHLFPKTALDDKWDLEDEDHLFNERLRFYRYEAGQYFAPHFDGCFRRDNGEMSLLTFIVYLNDGFDGGQTTFFPEGHVSMWNPKKVREPVAIDPKAGTALVFFHSGPDSPLHEGTPHFSQGMYKYACRSDIMYRHRVNASPRPPKAFAPPPPAGVAPGDNNEDDDDDR